MLEKTKLCSLLFASLALVACGKDEICDGGVDEDEDGLIDCADVEQCGADPVCQEVCDNGVDEDLDTLIDCADDQCDADPACEVTASIAAGLVNNADASVANAFAAFEITSVNVGVAAAAFVALVSDFNDPCALGTGGAAPADAKIGIVIGLAVGGDPEVVFAEGQDFTSNGQTNFVIYGASVITANAAVSSGISDQAAAGIALSLDKIGLDGFVSANGSTNMVFDTADAANFDTDLNGDGVNDAKAIAPTNVTLDFTNAENCPGLANALLGL